MFNPSYIRFTQYFDNSQGIVALLTNRFFAVEVMFRPAMGVLENIASTPVEEGMAKEYRGELTITKDAHGVRSMAGGQHHHRTNLDKYHPGYFGKVREI